jgi:hypothetical protein
LAVGELTGMGLILPMLARRDLPMPMRVFWLRCGAALGVSALWCLLVGMGVQAWIDVSTAGGLLVALAVWAVPAAVPALVFAVPAAWRRVLMGKLLRQKRLDQRQQA